MKNLLLAIISLTIMSAGANAALLQGDAQCAVDNTTINATACSGAWQGNDANQQLAVISQITSDFSGFLAHGSTWEFVEKTDAGETGSLFSAVPEDSNSTITFSSSIKNWFVLSLKAASNFSLYLFDGGENGIGSIEFSTIGTSTNGNSAQDLSHASLFRVKTHSVQDVPVTGTIGLFLIAGFVMMVKRKKVAQ